MKKILLATDGSQASLRAAQMVRECLKAWPEAQALILYVTQEPVYPVESVVPDTWDREENLAKEIEQQLRNHVLAEYTDRVRFEHKYGHPATTICDMATQANCDLIVVGSHGRSAVDRLLLGSVSQAVSHRAKVPVLIAKS